MKRTPLKRTGRINPVSQRQQRRNAVYSAAREYVYARSRGACEAPAHDGDCNGMCEQVHHMRGRVGRDPHDTDWLLGLSRACHEAAHREPAWAMRVGLSMSRLGGAS